MNDTKENLILQQVRQLFKQTMGEEVEINIDTQKSDIGEWDSVNHLNLIVELESEYQLNLSMDEIEHLNTVKQIVGLIQFRGKGTDTLK